MAGYALRVYIFVFVVICACALCKPVAATAAFFTASHSHKQHQVHHPLREYLVWAARHKHQPFFPLARHQQAVGASASPDGYKGILSLIFGSVSVALITIAFTTPAVIGLAVPGFFAGIAAIVFGAMHKTKNRDIGLAGLIMGIAGVAAVLFLLVAVIVALASFT